MSKGHIYIAANPSMPGVIKIGLTTTPVSKRLSSLSNSSVPTPFVLVEAVPCDHISYAEHTIHGELSHDRVTPNREFFTTDVSTAIAVTRRVCAAMNTKFSAPPPPDGGVFTPGLYLCRDTENAEVFVAYADSLYGLYWGIDDLRDSIFDVEYKKVHGTTYAAAVLVSDERAAVGDEVAEQISSTAGWTALTFDSVDKPRTKTTQAA